MYNVCMVPIKKERKKEQVYGDRKKCEKVILVIGRSGSLLPQCIKNGVERVVNDPRFNMELIKLQTRKKKEKNSVISEKCEIVLLVREKGKKSKREFFENFLFKCALFFVDGGSTCN